MKKKGKISLSVPRIDWDLGPNYVIGKQLGRGSYGMVCEAVHTPSGDRVAVKQVCRIFDQSQDCKRLLREISLMQRLDHPNVVKVREIIVPKDLANFNELFIVMDFAQSDLRKVFKSAMNLERDHIQLIAYTLLAGMKFIHSLNVLHRDLKPANILLNEDCEVKICDFGLARSLPEQPKPNEDVAELEAQMQQVMHAKQQEKQAAEETKQPASLSRPGLLRAPSKKVDTFMSVHVVTRWYRAPEVILLEREYSKPIDVWSVGCVLAELCGMLRENVPVFNERKPLFPGNSCFPLSPSHATKDGSPGFKADSNDQLGKIFQIIGTPLKDDLGFITDRQALKYIKSFGKIEKKNLQDIYPATDPELIELIEGMIRFDPRKRISIDQAISHPYFDEIRIPEVEQPGEVPPSFEFEAIEDISIAQLREFFVAEITRQSQTGNHPD